MNKLLIYFSVGGVTRRIAEYTGIPSVELAADHPYTDADILAANPKARVNEEQAAPWMRPKVHGCLIDGKVEEIYLGFPLWNLKAPRVIFTFLDNYKHLLTNTIINVFCTSGGSPITGAERELRREYPDLRWGRFRQFSYTSSREEVRRWVDEPLRNALQGQ